MTAILLFIYPATKSLSRRISVRAGRYFTGPNRTFLFLSWRNYNCSQVLCLFACFLFVCFSQRFIIASWPLGSVMFSTITARVFEDDDTFKTRRVSWLRFLKNACYKCSKMKWKLRETSGKLSTNASIRLDIHDMFENQNQQCRCRNLLVHDFSNRSFVKFSLISVFCF